MTAARRQRATPPPPPRPEPTPPENLSGIAHHGGDVKSLPVYLVLRLPHSAAKIAAVLDSLCNGEDYCRWESQRTLMALTELNRSTFAEGMAVLKAGIPDRQIPPLLLVTREALYPGKRAQYVYWPRWRQPDSFDGVAPGPRPGPGMEGTGRPPRRPDSRAPSRPESRAPEASPPPDRARIPGFEPSGNPGAPSYGSVFPKEETPEQEPSTACASPGGADPGSSAPAPPGAAGDELLLADFDALPESERAALLVAAAAPFPRSVRDRPGSPMVRGQALQLLRDRDPMRYAAPPAPAPPARVGPAAAPYRTEAARRLAAIDPGDVGAILDVADLIAEALDQEDSRDCFARIVKAAVDGERDRGRVARKVDQAIGYRRRPETVPAKYARRGDRAAGWWFTDVVYHHMPGPPLNKNTSPGTDSTRPRARRDDGRVGTVHPGS